MIVRNLCLPVLVNVCSQEMDMMFLHDSVCEDSVHIVWRHLYIWMGFLRRNLCITLACENFRFPMIYPKGNSYGRPMINGTTYK